MKFSTISRKYPAFRDDKFKNPQKWLQDKQIDDNAETLWRVHDKIYDLSNFIEHHPGGRNWLEMTKGTDITEAFETHHIHGTAEVILENFYVGDAKLERNYKVTFHSDGFYKTLKKRVALKLSNHVNQSPLKSMSKTFCDLTLAATFLAFILVSRDFNFPTAALAVFSLFSLTIISHNFLHQRDNWRMYLVNFSTQNYRDWRIFHVLSHHLYPNSYHDLEIILVEPFLNWMPIKKYSRYFYYFMSPFVYILVLSGSCVIRIVGAFRFNYKLYWDEILPLSIPLAMYLFGNFGMVDTLLLWYGIIMMTSFIYAFFAFNGSHHHNKIFHDGDELESMDFGIYQLAATFDRAELQKNQFLTLTTFGHHIAHHLFPTLDHSVLPELSELIHDTCKEFETELSVYPWYELMIGQFRQLGREKPRQIHLRSR
ncbi:hypothetical protein PVAND_005157 [Polypedilum vanderplanki]|uniref:Cytochrome b5 heme-binding domain-containing protein n=1 Tax=Polypedilum vanderplanki TaxID=319348 RepID=A0A9J6BZB4_POLVA|nr:hypothetical protein PVAND_005157 [Polypedilum vanderplanki]